MKTIEEYIKLAEEAVAGIKYPNEPAGLYRPIAYGLSNGGKRLRPALLLASSEILGKDCSMAMSQAAAIEMYHNFTLLHDDVMDNADIRRGKPTVCSKWNNNTAILSGDAMLSMSMMLMTKNVDAEKALRLSELFNRTAIEVYEGQQYDMEFESRNDVSIEEYIKMIRLKTSVLLGCACHAGLIMADADTRVCYELSEFAINLGLSFQLQDDLLDVYGDPAVFGKTIGGDIMNNKKTFLLINAMLLAKDDDKKELEYWLNNPNPFPGEKIAAVTALYNRLKVDKICRENIRHYNDVALRHLYASGICNDAIKFFEAFDKFVMGRKK